ncbi:hypothetical protein HID58_016883 [Brassica napus]|uniref:Uroporphyrinogen decarboxylase (URO-D) domain-containing protein n=1 Tax=Brassica napus TaxID=3708 RepID=A0ABQ8D5H4_BRANA|nr:hypothetical protein HID58_016883 [Brassica napus]
MTEAALTAEDEMIQRNEGVLVLSELSYENGNARSEDNEASSDMKERQRQRCHFCHADLVVEISLQPWKVFKPDGKGHIIFSPPQSAADVDQVKEFIPEESVPYVGEALKRLRNEVGNEGVVLGFVGAPFTLSSYVIEGVSSKNFTHIKILGFSQPKVLHALLQKFTTSMITYIRYQADSGSGGLLKRLARNGVDVVSLDLTVDMAEGRDRLGRDIAVQGNVDPGVLFGSKEFITRRIQDTVEKSGREKHILNLRHGIKVGTPEENVAHFFEVAQGIRY